MGDKEKNITYRDILLWLLTFIIGSIVLSFMMWTDLGIASIFVSMFVMIITMGFALLVSQ